MFDALKKLQDPQLYHELAQQRLVGERPGYAQGPIRRDFYAARGASGRSILPVRWCLVVFSPLMLDDRAVDAASARAGLFRS